MGKQDILSKDWRSQSNFSKILDRIHINLLRQYDDAGFPDLLGKGFFTENFFRSGK